MEIALTIVAAALCLPLLVSRRYLGYLLAGLGASLLYHLGLGIYAPGPPMGISYSTSLPLPVAGVPLALLLLWGVVFTLALVISQDTLLNPIGKGFWGGLFSLLMAMILLSALRGTELVIYWTPHDAQFFGVPYALLGSYLMTGFGLCFMAAFFLTSGWGRRLWLFLGVVLGIPLGWGVTAVLFRGSESDLFSLGVITILALASSLLPVHCLGQPRIGPQDLIWMLALALVGIGIVLEAAGLALGRVDWQGLTAFLTALFFYTLYFVRHNERALFASSYRASLH